MSLTDKLLNQFIENKTSSMSFSDKLKVTSYISKLSLKQLDKLLEPPKLYSYLMTFTLSPELVPYYKELKKLTPVFKYICKQFRRSPLGVTKAQIVMEGDGKTLHYHWHVAVQTKIPLKKDRFHYYQRIYGNIDIKGKDYDSYDTILNYISKINSPFVLI